MSSERSKELKRRIEGLMKNYPLHQGVLLPSLYAAEELYGWLSAEAIEEISHYTGVPTAEIKGVATFYAMYKHKPTGRHLIQMCTNVACLIEGAEDLVDFLKEKYGLIAGGTSADGRFSLVIMECIGACGTAPAMIVDKDAYDGLTKESLAHILEKYS